MKIPVRLHTGARVVHVEALLDSGSNDSFINRQYALDHGFTLKSLPKYLHRHTINADNSVGAHMVTEEVHVQLEYNGHREWMSIFVMQALDPLILGYSWFHRHNPQIDWWAQTLVLNHCPSECQRWQRIIHHQLDAEASQSLVQNQV